MHFHLRYFTLAGLLTIAVNQAHTQAIGLGTNTPQASAVFEMNSTTQGLLMPRQTTTQRNAIAAPAKGLLVFDTDLNQLFQYNGSSWQPVGGSGVFALPYSASVALPGLAFTIDNTGIAIQGSATANNIAAIRGNTTGIAGYGILGTNNAANSFGVGGSSSSGQAAVNGVALQGGTALRGVSTSGYGLLTSGNLLLGGGNTNPKEGAQLTSVDDEGNAVWKPKQVAFHLAGVYSSFQNVPSGGNWQKFHFSTELYDYANSTSPTNSASVNPSMSSFVAPVAGIYHFNFQAHMQTPTFSDKLIQVQAMLMINRSGQLIEAAHWLSPYTLINEFNALGQYYQLKAATDLRLQNGDIVYMQIKQVAQNSANGFLTNTVRLTSWSGHLVIAE